jgi:hypothetical protein
VKLVSVAAISALAIGSHTDSAGSNADQRDVDVVAFDYAFQVPKEAAPGTTTFRFQNKGKKRHELNIFLMKPGVTVTQVLELQKAGKSTQALVEGPVGVLFAEAGKSSPSRISTDLRPGREYGVICIFRDTAAAPRHFEMGMYSTIRVKAGKSIPSKAAAPVDTIVGFDYAFRYPRTVAAGKHTFVFRNDGKHRHEFSVTLLKLGKTLANVVEVDKVDGDIEPLIDTSMGLIWARAGEMTLGRLEMNLLPGREYLIDCGFTDDDKSQPHYKLGMYGSIKVSGKPAG